MAVAGVTQPDCQAEAEAEADGCILVSFEAVKPIDMFSKVMCLSRAKKSIGITSSSGVGTAAGTGTLVGGHCSGVGATSEF